MAQVQGHRFAMSVSLRVGPIRRKSEKIAQAVSSSQGWRTQGRSVSYSRGGATAPDYHGTYARTATPLIPILLRTSAKSSASDQNRNDPSCRRAPPGPSRLITDQRQYDGAQGFTVRPCARTGRTGGRTYGPRSGKRTRPWRACLAASPVRSGPRSEPFARSGKGASGIADRLRRPLSSYAVT